MKEERKIHSGCPSVSDLIASILCLIISVIVVFDVSMASETSEFRGRVRERGTKLPLQGINVFILPHKLKAVTGTKGEFEFPDVPEGDFELVINASGYKRLVVNPDRSKPKDFYLERETYNSFETTVQDRAIKRDEATRSLRRDQFLTMPGADGDPVKAVQNLPGVARPQGGTADVIIQGSAPEDTTYLIDQHEVPLIFHFGGLTSVVMPEAVDQVDYLSAGYGAEYSRALGGIVGLKTRRPAYDRWKGLVFVDTTKSGGLVEGPLGEKSSLLFSARYSYLGLVLKEVTKDNEDFNLTVAPTFADITSIYDYKINELNDFRLIAVGSRDELKFVLNKPVNEDPALRGNFSSETSFVRLIPHWTHRHSETAVSRVSFGVGKDWIVSDLNDFYFDLETDVLTQRAEYEKEWSPEWTTFLGMDNQYRRYSVGLRLPASAEQGGVRSPFASGQELNRKVKGESFEIGPYVRVDYKPDLTSLTLSPSFRTDYFSPTQEFLPAPRLASRYDLSDSLFLKAATGLYYQPPQPQETDEVVGNPDVKASQAIHYTVGLEKDFRNSNSDGFVVSPSVFYRDYDRLVIDSSEIVERNGAQVVERFNNKGEGRAYGLEVSLKWKKNNWGAFLSYTLSRSERKEPGQNTYPFEFDQTHNLNLVGQVDLSGNWRISSRFRYVSGNPITPIDSATFDSDNDVYVPKAGAFYSERLDSFLQLDVRVDKKWIRDSYILSAYLDLQNLTNQKNVEGISYSYDYSEKAKITGLPIIPSIGVQAIF